MFFKKNQKPQNRIDTLIGATTVIEGDIEFSGGLRIDGTVRGHVTEVSSQPGMLILSEQGHVDGTINVSHAMINGVVNGPVNVSEYVELQTKAKVIGDLRYKTLEMFVGAVVEGKLIHTGGASPVIAADDDD
jgi:cytoskeletal protein CcmA (bactofilin family)